MNLDDIPLWAKIAGGVLLGGGGGGGLIGWLTAMYRQSRKMATAMSHIEQSVDLVGIRLGNEIHLLRTELSGKIEGIKTEEATCATDRGHLWARVNEDREKIYDAGVNIASLKASLASR